MKRLLMISYPFPPNASAGAVRSERFARYLPRFGWKVEVVTIKPREDMFEDVERLKALGDDIRVNFTETLDPWLWLKNRKPKSLALRAIRSVLMRLFSFPDHMLLWVPFAVRKGIRISRTVPIDVIYTTSPPHSSHLAGLLLAKLLKKPWIADFRDPWTLNAYRGGGILERLLLAIERRLEKAVLRNADTVLANTAANRRNLLSAFPELPENKVVHMPNGWEEFPESCYKSHSENNGSFTIVHAGTFYPRFRPYGLLYALAEWRRSQNTGTVPPWGQNIRVILLGARDEETRRVVHELRLERYVKILPWVALEEARKTMAQAGLLWASLGTSKESSTYVPSKLFEYIAARRPILGFFPEGEAAALVRETRAGNVFTSDAPLPIITFLAKCIDENKNGNGCTYNPNIDRVNAIRVDDLIAEFHRILAKVC